MGVLTVLSVFTPFWGVENLFISFSISAIKESTLSQISPHVGIEVGLKSKEQRYVITSLFAS